MNRENYRLYSDVEKKYNETSDEIKNLFSEKNKNINEQLFYQRTNEINYINNLYNDYEDSTIIHNKVKDIYRNKINNNQSSWGKKEGKF